MALTDEQKALNYGRDLPADTAGMRISSGEGPRSLAALFRIEDAILANTAAVLELAAAVRAQAAPPNPQANKPKGV